jgi:hypothetical protein
MTGNNDQIFVAWLIRAAVWDISRNILRSQKKTRPPQKIFEKWPIKLFACKSKK